MQSIRLLTLLIAIFSTSNVGSQALFEEGSQSHGLNFEYKESLKMGGGAATFDFDNDGDDDIYIVGGQNPDGLFENDGSGHFLDISNETNITSLTSSLMTTSVVTGDIDNDGIREIFVGTIGDVGTSFESIKPNLLLKYNTSTSQFENIIESSLITDESFCMGAHFFDSNLDGLLDLYLINYISVPRVLQEGSMVVGFDHDCYENRLYINNGSNTFIDQTLFYGLEKIGCSLAATSSDLDWDGDSDIIIANDFGKWLEPNQLFQNEGNDSPYVDISTESGTNNKMYAMGIAVGDYDEDSDLDFYVTNIGKNALFQNQGNMKFKDIADSLDVQNNYTENGLYTTGWGAIFEDLNNDSYLDLFVSNGYVYSAVDEDDISQMDELYLGNSSHTFTNETSQSGIDFVGPSRGALHGDWNNDGHIDLITITNEKLFPSITNSINYYINNGSEKNWVGFELEGSTSNKDAYGAKILLYSGTRTLLKELRGGESHASQGSSRIHFGLDNIQEIDSIEIYWPNTNMQIIVSPSINMYHKIKEQTYTLINETGQTLNSINVYPNPSKNIFNIDIENDLNSECILQVYDPDGQMILKDKIFDSHYNFDLSSYGSGLYMLVCILNTQVITKPLIIIPQN